MKEKKKLSELEDRKHLNTRHAIMMRKLHFLAIYAIIQSVDKSCQYLGIKPSSVKRWINNDEVFEYNFKFLSDVVN